MKILVTGANGFLGSSLALSCLNSGYQVAILLRPNSKLTRLKGLENQFEIINCEKNSDIDLFIQKFQPDFVIHTACVYGRNGESNFELIDTNIRLGVVILDAIQKNKKHVTFINTASALNPELNTYALSKYQFAEFGKMIAQQPSSKIQFINVMLQHMYGPNDDPTKFLTHVIHSCHNNQVTLKLTEGKQTRDFIFIDDVVNAYLILIKKIHILNKIESIEVGSGSAPTIKDTVELIHSITQSKTKLVFGAIPYRPNEIMNCKADISFMKKLGWNSVYDLETGLKKTIKLEFLI